MLSEHPNGAIEHIAHHEPAQAHYLLTNDAARLIGVAPQTIWRLGSATVYAGAAHRERCAAVQA